MSSERISNTVPDSINSNGHHAIPNNPDKQSVSRLPEELVPDEWDFDGWDDETGFWSYSRGTEEIVQVRLDGVHIEDDYQHTTYVVNAYRRGKNVAGTTVEGRPSTFATVLGMMELFHKL